MYLEEKKQPPIVFAGQMPPVVAPIREWDQDWQREGRFYGDWLLQLARDFQQADILLDQVLPGSPLYCEVNRTLREAQLNPIHVVDRDCFFNYPELTQDLSLGLQFAVRIEDMLSPRMLEQMEELKAYRSQLSFVITARKDVRYRDLYRAFPHPWRDRLFVDFPLSQSSLDPYFSVSEAAQLRKQMAADFGQTTIPSFCPELLSYTAGAAQNISHFTIPRKMSEQSFRVSLVSHSPDIVKALGSFPALQKQGSELELLVTRVAGQKTQVVPRVSSLLTTRYWIHLRDPGGRVSSSLVRNFSATQATGEYVLFLTSETLYLFEMVLEEVLSGRSDEESFVREHGLLLFRTDLFKKIGGFDPLYVLEESQFVDLRHRYLLAKTGRGLSLEQIQTFFKTESGGFEELQDRRRLLQRHPEFLNQVGDLLEKSPALHHLSRPQFGQRGPLYYRLCDLRDRYLSLYQSTIGVLLEGHLRYLTWPFRAAFRFLSSQAWRVRPGSYPAYWKVRSALQSNLWRLDPRTAPWMWRMKSQWWRVRGQLWRVSPQQLGWHLFRLSYPIRKVYYFLQFQYEKRILGLHHKGKASRGRQP